MKRFPTLTQVFFLVLMLASTGASTVRASIFEEEDVVLEHAVVAPLMEWVEARLGVRVPMLPQVMISHTTFQKVLARQGGQWAGRPQALYVPGRVVVDQGAWDAESVWSLSLIVHELVHHAQASMTDVRWACPDQREAQAYTVQNAWLAEQNAAPFVDVAWIEHVSACPNTDTAEAMQTGSQGTGSQGGVALASVPGRV